MSLCEYYTNSVFPKKRKKRYIFSVSISVIPISRDCKSYMNLTSDNEKNKIKYVSCNLFIYYNQLQTKDRLTCSPIKIQNMKKNK